jgi:hypothetical protein
MCKKKIFRSKINNGLLESDPSLCRLKSNLNKSVENLSQISEENKTRKRSAGSLSGSFRFSSLPKPQPKLGHNLELDMAKIQISDQMKTPPVKPKRKNAVSPLVLDLSALNENASLNL